MSQSEEPPKPTKRRRLASRVRLPTLSGKVSAAWLAICFLLTGVLIPVALRLPLWVAFEIVVAVWWMIWTVVLTAVLYSGHRVSDDHQLGQFGRLPTFDADGNARSGCGNPGCASFDGDGAWVVIAVLLLLVFGWLLIEFVIPFVVFILYFTTRGMLANIVNDRHSCQGRLDRSVAWGTVWATLYTAPLAAAVWAVHYLAGAAG